jgi:hypothetical protein
MKKETAAIDRKVAARIWKAFLLIFLSSAGNRKRGWIRCGNILTTLTHLSSDAVALASGRLLHTNPDL